MSHSNTYTTDGFWLWKVLNSIVLVFQIKGARASMRSPDHRMHSVLLGCFIPEYYDMMVRPQQRGGYHNTVMYICTKQIMVKRWQRYISPITWSSLCTPALMVRTYACGVDHAMDKITHRMTKWTHVRTWWERKPMEFFYEPITWQQLPHVQCNLISTVVRDCIPPTRTSASLRPLRQTTRSIKRPADRSRCCARLFSS
jgi:hypothetical protein